MATAMAYPLSRQDSPPNNLATDNRVYHPGLSINDFDFSDTRYPLSGPRRNSTQPNGPPVWNGREDEARRVNSDPTVGKMGPVPEVREESRGQVQVQNVSVWQQQYQVQPSRLEAVVSYALPPDNSRRVVDRYSLDENRDGLVTDRGNLADSPQEEDITASQHLPSPNLPDTRDRPVSMATPRHPSLLPASGYRDSTFSPIIPSSAGPSYNSATLGIPVPISPKPRAYVQQPTYVNPPNPMNPIYLPNPSSPPEEICVECAMRDQDMADVDVTSPGVWERQSDVFYEDLVRRELEEDPSEALSSESHRSNRPKATGGKLTEPNVKLWLSVNPREPQAKQQTLQAYLKSQRALLEAETLAHARAMQESRQLENRMRDTYSQLRRSAYDTGNGAAVADELGGVRIQTPRSPSGNSGPVPHTHSHSREVTLLENGLIVEHVNVKKEERDERERRRKEEKQERSRARKTSRGSVYSVHSLAGPLTDSGVGLRPNTYYSASTSARPTSAVTTYDRPGYPRAYSTASFSDVHSLGSGSPRQRFFGFKNLSSGFRSRDSLAPSGMSGSMVDMHVALQREGYDQRVHSPIDIGSKVPSLWHSQVWPSHVPPQIQLEEIPKKKKKGLAKIWSLVTGSKDKGNSQASSYSDQRSMDRTEDDLPLAPPPPISYLVERHRPVDHNIPNARQSTASLSSVASAKNAMSSPAMSPGTAPSSLLPSPTSSRPSNAEPEVAGDSRKPSWGQEERDQFTDDNSKLTTPRIIHSVTSEPDIRRYPSEIPSSHSGLTVPGSTYGTRPQSVLLRDKSLPPLPPGASHAPPSQQDSRRQTVYSYSSVSPIPKGASPPVEDLAAPRAPFRSMETRRQSFGGMTSRPTFAAQTMPSSGFLPQESRPPMSYDEFGSSRRSLGYFQEKPSRSRPATPSKRRSKFGLAMFLGRKSQMYETDQLSSHDFPQSRDHGTRDELTNVNGYAHSGSRHSLAPRLSVLSRKALEEREPVDDLIAYRYPSNEQRLDLLR